MATEQQVEGRMISDQSSHDNMLNRGLRLASLSEAEGGWGEYFNESEGMNIEDDFLKASTAQLMENTKNWMIGESIARGRGCRKDSKGRYILDEATRSGLVGGFSDYLFPIIRASFPTNPVNDLFSVQPTNRRTATVVYWNWIYASTKGNITAGQRAFDANIGKPDANYHYSDNVIVGETVGTATASATFTGTLAYNDGGGVIPGTVQLTTVTAGGNTANFYDNGVGGWVATFSAGGGSLVSGTINYTTGAISITTTGDNFTTNVVTANYQWGSEGSASTPQMDVQIITSTTETQRRALRLNYSMEAMFDVNAEFGVSLEDNLMSGCAEQLNYEIARQLIAIAWGVAPVVTNFPITPPSTNYSKQQYFMDIVYYCDYVSNYIWTQTQKAFANWIIVDFGAANVIESMSSTLFEAAPRPANVSGVHFIGTLAGKYRVYKDVQLNKLPGASAYGNLLFGWKSNDFWSAGLVYSPYQLLYTTETLMTSDFLAQKGVASRYATKLVNNAMYAIMTLSQ
jgi:hypothetical protein